MYLAQNKTDMEQALTCFAERMQAQPELHWAALVDSAFDDSVDGPKPRYRGVNCYEEAPLDELASVGPWLIPLDADEKGFQRLAELLAQCSGRPMLSVTASRIDASALAERWFPLHRVRTPDEQSMVLRFVDTRILPTLPSILQPAQWAAFASSLEHWFYVDRTGVIAACELPPPDPSAASAPIRLTQAQVNAFLDAGEPDALIDHLADQQPNLFPWEAQPATIHQYVAQAQALAKKCQVQDWDDQVTLVAAEFTTRGKIHANPQLEPLLRSRQWPPGQLLAALKERGLI